MLQLGHRTRWGRDLRSLRQERHAEMFAKLETNSLTKPVAGLPGSTTIVFVVIFVSKAEIICISTGQE